MRREFFDRRLHALAAVCCPSCRRDGAQATGQLCEVGSVWKFEVRCERCGELRLVAIADAELRRLIADRADILGAGLAGDANPATEPDTVAPVEAQRAALLHVRETVSQLSRSMRRGFDLTIDAAGLVSHAAVPAGGRFTASPVRREVVAPGVLGPLLDLIDRSGLDAQAGDLGRGEQYATFSRPDAAPRTLRWTQFGSARAFAGDPRVGPAVVDLADGLSALLAWIDAGGPAPAWPADGATFFPHRGDLLGAVPAARLTTTHDWDGSSRFRWLDEVWVAASGLLESRRIDKVTGELARDGHRVRRLAPDEVRALFARLGALDPSGFRPRLGYVGADCSLDETHTHIFDWFDGARVFSSRLVFGSERGIGAVFGDTPPNAAEGAAFDLLGALRR